MKLSFLALRQILDFPGTVEECAALLAELGFPNDGIEKKGEALRSVIVGQIESKRPHPQADRLSLLKVKAGHQVLDIVCGAKNMVEGDLVALAPVGAKIPGKDGSGITLERAKIRGEVSEGMCCSLAELALGQEADGIWILPKERFPQLESALGRPVAEFFPELEDAVIEVDVTPNRGDALSIRGLARELAAKCGLKLKPLKIGRWKSPSSQVKPSVENFEEIYGFLACHVDPVKVGPTPSAYQQFLQSMGARSINNLVDITNIVLFELGHPIHFFDAEKLDPHTLVARMAREGETLKLLDGRVIELHPEDIVIADQHRVLSLAGVMGGFDSGVSDSTKSMIVEVASFNPKRIRATARRHQISSEASYRFERGVTPHRLEEALERALGLLQELSGYETATGSKVVSRSPSRSSCLWDRKKVEAKIGKLELSDNQIFDRLRLLEYEFEPRAAQPQVSFPWYRTDADRLEDVMEDVARLIGYEHLAKSGWIAEESTPVIADLRQNLQVGHKILERLVHLGFSQSIHWSFSRPELESLFSETSEALVNIANPIHSEKSVLRQQIVPQLLETARRNASHMEEDIRLVEMGPVFKTKGSSDYQDSPCAEEWRIACVWYPKAFDAKRLWQGKEDSFFQFKGMVTQAFHQISGRPGGRGSYLHPLRQWMMPGGVAGEVHPRIMKALDLSGRAFAGEWSLRVHERAWKFKAVQEFPFIDLDVCFVFSKDLRLQEVETLIQKKRPEWLKLCRPYDIYEDKKSLGEGKKAVTFALRYRDETRTLSLEEVKVAHEKLLKSVLGEFGPEKIALR